MKPKLKRFLASLFIPPLTASVAFTVLSVIDGLGRNDGVLEILYDGVPLFLFFWIWGLFFTFTPSLAYYFAMNALRRRYAPIRERRFAYTATGAALGTLCGIAIGLVFSGFRNPQEALAIFTPIGALAGAVTAFATHTSESSL